MNKIKYLKLLFFVLVFLTIIYSSLSCSNMYHNAKYCGSYQVSLPQFPSFDFVNILSTGGAKWKYDYDGKKYIIKIPSGSNVLINFNNPSALIISATNKIQLDYTDGSTKHYIITSGNTVIYTNQGLPSLSGISIGKEFMEFRGVNAIGMLNDILIDANVNGYFKFERDGSNSKLLLDGLSNNDNLQLWKKNNQRYKINIDAGKPKISKCINEITGSNCNNINSEINVYAINNFNNYNTKLIDVMFSGKIVAKIIEKNVENEVVKSLYI
jgi:hypothetical protein